MSETVLPVSMKEKASSSETFFIEMYIVELRTGTMYLCATDVDIEYNGNRYIAVPFQRQSVTKSMDNIVDSCQITLSDCNDDLLAYVVNGFDFRGCMVTVFRIMYPDSLKDPSIFQWMFSGTIDEPSFSDGTFSCKLTSKLPMIEAPNRSYQLACNSSFGDECCTMSLGTTNVTVTSVSSNGLEINVNSSFGNNHFKDGTITISGETRIIVVSNGSSITVNVNFLQDNIVGKTATLAMGCNKTKERCAEYGNLIHYSGFPAVPFESVYR